MANYDGNCFETELISEDGKFKDDQNIANIKNVLESVKTEVPYGVISIIGPQNGGKSELQNQLAGTKFKVMDAELGSSKTTRGIWIATSQNMNPFTIVLDVEGTDGQNDTTFEKQSSLFALSVSDVVLLNL